uniref:Tudor-knot domain-containing protein n=1 Tax=Setaria digitata TaxID=48799 RepID=A0A915PGU4_9BILA
MNGKRNSELTKKSLHFYSSFCEITRYEKKYHLSANMTPGKTARLHVKVKGARDRGGSYVPLRVTCDEPSVILSMSKRSKKDRSLPPTTLPPELLTPSTVLKVGEAFIVLRRAPNKNGVTDERCLATVVEIREGEQASTSLASATTSTTFSTDDMDICTICTNLLNDVSGEKVPVEVDIATRKEQCKMYYVHYDGMDRRLDEWVGRNRIVARANPNAFTSVLVQYILMCSWTKLYVVISPPNFMVE